MSVDKDQPVVLALERANVQVSRLQAKLRMRDEKIASLNVELTDEKVARLTAESEARRWKSRCYPSPAEIREAGITEASASDWLDKHLTPCESGWSVEVEPGEYEVLERWRPTDDLAFEIAWSIEFVSGMLGIDQWQVLEEMRPRAKTIASALGYPETVPHVKLPDTEPLILCGPAGPLSMLETRDP